MRTLSILALLLTTFPLAGCASTISAWKNRGVASHTLRPNRFFTLTGERRLAFQVDRYDPATSKPQWDSRNKRWVSRVAWCAESLPDASQAVTATSKPTVKFSDKANLGIDDAYATTLVQTFARTEIAEVYRQMGWQACQAWAQGVYDDAHYREQLDRLLASGTRVIEERAKQPLIAPAKSDTDSPPVKTLAVGKDAAK